MKKFFVLAALVALIAADTAAAGVRVRVFGGGGCFRRHGAANVSVAVGVPQAHVFVQGAPVVFAPAAVYAAPVSTFRVRVFGGGCCGGGCW